MVFTIPYGVNTGEWRIGTRQKKTYERAREMDEKVRALSQEKPLALLFPKGRGDKCVYYPA